HSLPFTLSLHDALPICNRPLLGLLMAGRVGIHAARKHSQPLVRQPVPDLDMQSDHTRMELFADRHEALHECRSELAAEQPDHVEDRKSTRLNSSHQIIS